MNWAVRFLGVGNAAAPALGNASVVIERDGEPMLMIDCGPLAIDAYCRQYGGPPRALFITHCHFDHIGGMETLFARVRFGAAVVSPQVFVPSTLIAVLHARVGEYPGVTAEGGCNFWDPFRLLPVVDRFWLDGQRFQVFPVRHGPPGSAFGLRLPGSLVYPGDPRPIVEVLRQVADQGERIAHDCDLHGNPAHSGLDELQRDYPQDLLDRLLLYHYANADAGAAMAARGFAVAEQGAIYALAEPLASETPA